ncbi:MAG: twin-arginine translocation pathway signal protein [Methylotenera sp. 24-45-7]|jgi:isoquinoline 1-oxidoreductase beta subunit|nr:MAG: twin-arginine translocation pathway signal protein [Mehylophilales bacterium 35-46-6]OYZ41385.1 MAG: twin-arginine translocation pathway signal protein [Methylotenera sp. 24-45-7]OZA53378.1 MAG: twin-arginine translocation pathway signal protein [Methylophilales bacterium 39-45-7]HQS37589.1 xanthine dehydrogenase family protein molybdopterin-binding subunit [Methylotenera sp.]HQS43122.1 xanthine dehydrogenase family protein molybdopterin-binding subunit [Methylotenera sp.]
MTAPLNISRRTFIKASALVVGGLVIAFSIPQAKRFLLPGAQDVANKDAAKLPEPNAFLRIGTDNTITVMLAHSEMGQSIWTTLPMLIAEELDADWSKIKVEHAKAAPEYVHTAYGIQITGGSSTTWSEFDRYRQAGALTRALLVAAAAEEFGVAAETLRTEDGFVISGDKKISYGELAERAAGLDTPKAVTLKQPKDWKIIGKATKRLDGPEKINGTAIFGQDIHFDGLKIAMVARSPVFGGTVKSYDASAAKQIKGVQNVVQVPTGVAVIADHYWAAKQGRDALKVEWDLGAGASLDTPAMLAQYRELAARPGATAAQAGDVNAAKPAKIVEAEYVLPFLAHSPMEPLNCAVKISDDGCEIWTGTQMQTTDQQAAAKILGLKPEQVKIHTVFLGGGFGRRANPAADFVSEAVQVAKAAGVPVKTVWSREDDVKGGYYRPMFLHQAKIGLAEDGMPSSWQHVEVGQSIMVGTPFEQFMIKDGVDATSVEGVADSPYVKGVANHHVSLHTPKSPIPVLWWRSVGHSHSAFVMESLIDELAHAAGKDTLEYRRTLLKDHPRHLAALNLAAEKAGWGKPLPKGVFRGIAVHESFGSYVAQVAEVSVNKGAVKVHRVVCAIDCGLSVNPDSLVAQMESSVAFGLGAALQSKITFKDGMVEQSNFHDYNVLRMADMPKVEVHIVPSTEKMGGVGEPAVPPLAPAVTNAIFAATGKRIRSLPIADQLA